MIEGEFSATELESMGEEPRSREENISNEYLFIENRFEAKYFWRLVSKFPQDHPRVARIFCEKFPTYDYLNVLQFLHECKQKAKTTRVPGGMKNLLRKVPQTTDKELQKELAKADKLLEKENADLGAKRVHLKRKEILNLPVLDSFLANLVKDSDFPGGDRGLAFYRKRSLDLIKQMLRTYLSKVIAKSLELELGRRYLMFDASIYETPLMIVKDKEVINEAVNLIGGPLKISQRAFQALDKEPDPEEGKSNENSG
jgi:hypothetical protein